MNVVILLLLYPAALLVLLAPHWRAKLSALAFQYLLIFALLAQSWPLTLTAVKAVAAFSTLAILAYTQLSIPNERIRDQQSSGLAFKFSVYLLVVILVNSFAPQTRTWIPALGPEQALAGFLLIGTGIIHLALQGRALPTIIGLLTLFSGFELIYAAVEISSLLAALLALINMGIALVGAFLILLPSLEPAE